MAAEPFQLETMTDADMKYITRTTKMTVLPQGDPIFSENATHIEIADDAAGEFLKLTQDGGHTDHQGSVCVDYDEWPIIKETIEAMMEDIKAHEQP